MFRFRSERVWDDDDVHDTSVNKVMLLGDIHNRRPVLETALQAADDEGCDVLVQVGDFWLQDCAWRGFSPHQAELMWTALNAPIPVVVVDGNHEVWPCLSGFQQRPDTQTARRDGRPLHLGGSLWWADRGSVWEWGGARFGALGGTVSPDKWIPRLAPYRWAEETTTQQDLDRLIGNASDGLDVLVCHDAPTDTTGLVSGLPWKMPNGVQREADRAQELVQSAIDATSPTVVFHGHWHQKNRCHLNRHTTEVFGLAADGHPGSTAVLTVQNLQARHTEMNYQPER